MINLPDPHLSPNEEQVIAKKGLTFVITLESKPTSGYTWVPSFDESFISLLSRKFRPNSSLIGSSGHDIFNFQARKLGVTRIKMSHKRSWEELPIEQKRYVINVI